MYEFWYDKVKPKQDKNAKLCYIDTDSFIVHVKTDDIYKDIEEDVETRFGTSNFELDRPLSKGKNYLYAKDPYEVKYQSLINKREKRCLKYLND